MQTNRLPKILRLMGLAVIAAGILIWLSAGRRLGWTQTSIAETKTDPVTELQYTEYKDGFVAGIEFPAAGLAAGAGLLAASWVASRRTARTA